MRPSIEIRNNIWVISDTHWDHANILTFKKDGNLIRPGFTDINHMNQTMVDNWNRTVKPGDKVYHLGDVGDPSFVKLCHGQKRLVLGNHDRNTKGLLGAFKKVMVWRKWKIDGIVFAMSHIPLHLSADAIPGKTLEFNVHGHTHVNSLADKRYINVCVEQTNYHPVHIEDLVKIMKSR